MPRVPRKLALFAAPVAVLALGAVSYGSLVAFGAASPSPPAVTQPAPSASERAESTTTPETAEMPEAAEPNEANERNEPALPGGGHADTDNVQADTQQEGVH